MANVVKRSADLADFVEHNFAIRWARDLKLQIHFKTTSLSKRKFNQ